MGHLIMIFGGILAIIMTIDKFDWSHAFLICLIALWIWDYNDINRRAKKNPRSYYNRRKRK